MAEPFTYTLFADRVGETFRLRLDAEHAFDLVLTTATSLSDKPYDYPGRDPARTPFSLLFRGPRDPVLPQRIYQLANEQLGTLELFIVPIGRDASGVEYEANFS